MGSLPTTMASCCGDKTGLHRSGPKETAWSKSVSSLTFAARASTVSLTILPQVKDFVISVVDLLVASDKSNPSGNHLGCIDLTFREHEEGCLASQVNRVIPFGLTTSPFLRVRVSTVLSRMGQLMFQSEELRVQTSVDDPARVS